MNARRRHMVMVFAALALSSGLFLGLRVAYSQTAQPTAAPLVAAPLVAAPLVAVPPASAPAVADGATVWTIDAWSDFVQGTPNNTAIHQPGDITLDRTWWPDVRVNAPTSDSKFSPRTSWVISSSGGLTATVWLTVWADERQADHSPDIYLAQSLNGGRSWLPDIMIDDGCDPDDSPYPECPGHFGPDITARIADNSLWVVWQQEEAGSGADAGNIYYAASNDIGATWPVKNAVTNDSGKQHWPRIATNGATLYTIWESERDDDGNIVIARYNPDTDGAWSTPIPVSDDTTGAEQSQPALTVDGSGNLYAVWTDERTNSSGDIYFSRWLSGTTWADGAWSAAVQLSHADADWGVEPDIKASPDGSLYATWTERVPTGPATYDFQIIVARSSDRGANWTATVVNRLFNASASNAFYQAPALGVMHPSRILVTWLHSPDAQAATSNILAAVSYDRGAHWGAPRRLNTASTVDVDSFPAVATDFAGNAVVAWQDFRLGSSTHIFATGYPADRYVLRGNYQAAVAPDATATWGTLVWTATVPANTALSLSTRVFINAAIGWTDWITHTVSPATLTHDAGEVLLVQANFTSDGFDSAILDAIQVTYESSSYLYLPLLIRGD